jgi:hypothetical protein
MRKPRYWRIVAGHPVSVTETPPKSVLLGDWLRKGYVSVGFHHRSADPSLKYFRDSVEKGDEVVVTTDGIVWAIGRVTGSMKTITATQPVMYRHRRNVRWCRLIRQRVSSYPKSVRRKLSNPRTLLPLSNEDWIHILETMING